MALTILYTVLPVSNNEDVTDRSHLGQVTPSVFQRMSSGDCRPTHWAVRRMQRLIIVTFSWSSDALVMCFIMSLHSFIVRSVLDSTFRLVVVGYIGDGYRWELQV
jgi:hypothetical protein